MLIQIEGTYCPNISRMNIINKIINLNTRSTDTRSPYKEHVFFNISVSGPRPLPMKADHVVHFGLARQLRAYSRRQQCMVRLVLTTHISQLIIRTFDLIDY